MILTKQLTEAEKVIQEAEAKLPPSKATAMALACAAKRWGEPTQRGQRSRDEEME